MSIRIQIPLFEPISIWSPPKINELPSWESANRVAIDIETCDPDLRALGPGEHRNGRMVGISFAIEDSDHAYYLPIGHALEGNLATYSVLRYLRDQARVFKGTLVGQNLSYDLGFLRKAGVVFHPKRFRDVRLAAAILNEHAGSYTLNAIAQSLGVEGKEETGLDDAAKAYGLKNPKSEMWKLPARHVAPYAIRDVTLPLELLRIQERRIDNQDLWDVYDLESDILPVAVKMREKGVRVDIDKLEYIQELSAKKEIEYLSRVQKLTGHLISPKDINKKDAKAPVLESIGIKLETTDSGQKKIDADLLRSIDHPVGDLLLRAQTANKIRTTFVASVKRSLVGDRIHCTLNQMRREDDYGGGLVGTVSGRMSATKPNLQQQPSRNPEWGALWRSIYIPEDGELWACMDFSSQEPRIAAHYAAECGCSGADKIVAAYQDNPRLDFHSKMSEIAGVPRKQAKTLFLGVLYGMGEARLCQQLGYEVFDTGRKYKGRKILEAGAQGKKVMNEFHATVPFAMQLKRLAQSRAEHKGEVRTWGGRAARFEEKEEGGFGWTHKALNRIIQGTAADQLKMALRDLDRAGMCPLLPVHDELDDSVSSPEEALKRAEIMVNAMPLWVPNIVDVEIGPNWGDIKEID